MDTTLDEVKVMDLPLLMGEYKQMCAIIKRLKTSLPELQAALPGLAQSTSEDSLSRILASASAKEKASDPSAGMSKSKLLGFLRLA